eukprot:scaffold303588_cov35-Tisochrysis_lutea.AAC.2
MAQRTGLYSDPKSDHRKGVWQDRMPTLAQQTSRREATGRTFSALRTEMQMHVVEARLYAARARFRRGCCFCWGQGLGASSFKVCENRGVKSHGARFALHPSRRPFPPGSGAP